jgi:dolichol-phosphate mannosyltransferase
MSQETLVVPNKAGRRRRKVYVVLPAYNEEACIARLLDKIDEAMFEADQPYHIIVVDDGSKDRTAAIVEEFGQRVPITLQRHAVNRGLGATIRDGLSCASGLSEQSDIIVTMDADDTHTPGLIVRMVRMINEGHDVVIASRYQQGSRTVGVPWSRRLTSFAGSLLFRAFLPIKGVKDFTCGFRAYRSAVLKKAISEYGGNLVDQEGFQCMVDILLKLRRLNLLFGEVPFILRYDQKEGASKMRVGSTIVKTLHLILRRRLGL